MAFSESLQVRKREGVIEFRQGFQTLCDNFDHALPPHLGTNLSKVI